MRKDSVVDVGILVVAAVLLQSTPVQWLMRIVRLLLRVPPSTRWRTRVVPLAVQMLKVALFFVMARGLRDGASRLGIHRSVGMRRLARPPRTQMHVSFPRTPPMTRFVEKTRRVVSRVYVCECV